MRVRFKSPSCLLVVSLRMEYLFFPDTIQTNHSQTQLHKEESLFFVKGMLVAPLLTAGVSEEVAQKSQMPISPQILDDVEEPMPARPATLKDLRHSRSNRDGTAQSETLSESALVQDVRRLSRTGFTASRTVENRRSCASTSV